MKPSVAKLNFGEKRVKIFMSFPPCLCLRAMLHESRIITANLRTPAFVGNPIECKPMGIKQQWVRLAIGTCDISSVNIVGELFKLMINMRCWNSNEYWPDAEQAWFLGHRLQLVISWAICTGRILSFWISRDTKSYRSPWNYPQKLQHKPGEM